MASNNNENNSYKGFILAFAVFSVTALGVGGLQCENGFVEATREKRVGDEISMIQVCCEDVTCGPGQKVVACEEDDPYSSACVPCETGRRQETWTSLATGGGSCTPNVDCNKLFRVTKFAGNSTSNSECGDCFLGYKNANNQLITKECLVNNCPPGQEPERDGCQNCSSMHFSATMDNLPCKKRTNCSTEGKCTKREGNITHDNECSTDVPYCKNTTNDTPSDQIWYDWYIAPIVLSILGGITVAGVIVYCRKKRNIERRREREKRAALAVVIVADTDTPPGQTTESLQGAPTETEPGHSTGTQPGHPTTAQPGNFTNTPSGSYTKPTECTEDREADKKTPRAPNSVSGTASNHSTANGNFSVENEAGLDSRTFVKRLNNTTGSTGRAGNYGQPPPPPPTPPPQPPALQPNCAEPSLGIDSLKLNSDPNRNRYDAGP